MLIVNLCSYNGNEFKVIEYKTNRLGSRNLWNSQKFARNSRSLWALAVNGNTRIKFRTDTPRGANYTCTRLPFRNGGNEALMMIAVNRRIVPAKTVKSARSLGSRGASGVYAPDYFRSAFIRCARARAIT